jgi:hypothetical protein
MVGGAVGLVVSALQGWLSRCLSAATRRMAVFRLARQRGQYSGAISGERGLSSRRHSGHVSRGITAPDRGLVASADAVCKSEVTTSVIAHRSRSTGVVASELAVHVVGRDSLLQRLCACVRVGLDDDVRHGYLPFCREITTGQCGVGSFVVLSPGARFGREERGRR